MVAGRAFRARATRRRGLALPQRLRSTARGARARRRVALSIRARARRADRARRARRAASGRRRLTRLTSSGALVRSIRVALALGRAIAVLRLARIAGRAHRALHAGRARLGTRPDAFARALLIARVRTRRADRGARGTHHGRGRALETWRSARQRALPLMVAAETDRPASGTSIWAVESFVGAEAAVRRHVGAHRRAAAARRSATSRSTARRSTARRSGACRSAASRSRRTALRRRSRRAAARACRARDAGSGRAPACAAHARPAGAGAACLPARAGAGNARPTRARAADAVVAACSRGGLAGSPVAGRAAASDRMRRAQREHRRPRHRPRHVFHVRLPGKPIARVRGASSLSRAAASCSFCYTARHAADVALPVCPSCDVPR